jgi:hypothetical protein
MKLKLSRETATLEPDPADRMKFPVHAVRELPGPYRTHGRMPSQEKFMPDHDRSMLRLPQQIREIEATLDRMQAGVDQLTEQVNNYKFPGFLDEDRPRAA